MGIFSKKPQTTHCPVCSHDFEGDRQVHWETHLDLIPPGFGEASGQFTWECPKCGPANMKWPTTGGASAGMAVHMSERHGIPLV